MREEEEEERKKKGKPEGSQKGRATAADWGTGPPQAVLLLSKPLPVAYLLL